MAPSDVHIRNRIIISKATSALSMVSSFFIMRDVYRRRKRGEIPLTSSLVFLMSCCDFFFSFFVTFLNSWMVPKDTGVYLASGNQSTCAAQGFMYVFFLTSTILTNASLAIAYCLKVRWRRVNIYSHQKVLWALHLLPPFVGFCLAVAALLDGAYNISGGGLCEIAPYPYGCRSPDSDFECTRGLNAEKLMLARLSVAIAANIVVISSIILLIEKVLAQERKMDNYTLGRTASRRENTSKTTWQGIWYIAAFELSYTPWYIWQILFLVTDGKIVTVNVSVVPGYILAFLFPSQSSWNALVYFRPRYKSLRKRHRSDSRLSLVNRLLSLAPPPQESPTAGDTPPLQAGDYDVEGEAGDDGDPHNHHDGTGNSPDATQETHDSRIRWSNAHLENENSQTPIENSEANISSSRRTSLPVRLLNFTWPLRSPIILGDNDDSLERSWRVNRLSYIDRNHSSEQRVAEDGDTIALSRRSSLPSVRNIGLPFSLRRPSVAVVNNTDDRHSPSEVCGNEESNITTVARRSSMPLVRNLGLHFTLRRPSVGVNNIDVSKDQPGNCPCDSLPDKDIEKNEKTEVQTKIEKVVRFPHNEGTCSHDSIPPSVVESGENEGQSVC